MLRDYVEDGYPAAAYAYVHSSPPGGARADRAAARPARPADDGRRFAALLDRDDQLAGAGNSVFAIDSRMRG